MTARKPAAVLIQGDGIAALCCARLLGAAGVQVALQRVARAPVPSIMLSLQALAMLRDVFGRPDLLAGSPVIERRIVGWGKNEATALPHSAVVVAEEALIAELADGLDLLPTVVADFTIRTFTPAFPERHLRFGTRRGTAAAVRVRNDADRAACWIEAVDGGWLFLVPNPLDVTWLLGVGAPIEDLLRTSRLIAPRIDLLDGRSPAFDTCPRIAATPCGQDWLTAGTAAIAFDPICGDGAAQAVREAVLAAAVIVGIAEGGCAPSLLSHYNSMLIATMRRHLALCTDFYRTGGNGDWWQAELSALRAGHDWCTAQLATAAEPKYALHGFRLLAREAA